MDNSTDGKEKNYEKGNDDGQLHSNSAKVVIAPSSALQDVNPGPDPVTLPAAGGCGLDGCLELTTLWFLRLCTTISGQACVNPRPERSITNWMH